MRQTLFILFLFIIIASACKEDDVNIYEVKAYAKANIQEIKIKGLENLFATNICLFNNIAVVETNAVEDFFHVIDWKNKALLWSFGKPDGPNALVRPECNCQFIEENDSLRLVIINKARRLSLVNIYPQMDTINLMGSAKTYIMPEMYLPKEVFLVDKGKKIIGNGGVDGVIFSHDLDNRITTWSNNRPDISKKYERAIIDLIYTADAAVDYENQMIIVGYRLFNQISIFDFDGNFLNSIYYGKPKSIEPIIENSFPSMDNILYYGNHLVVKDEKIFSLYGGEPQRARRERESSGEALFSYMHIVDYNGSLLNAIKIDRKIGKFDVQGNTVVALTDSDDNPNSSNIIVFNY